jgi:hypothetical protein
MWSDLAEAVGPRRAVELFAQRLERNPAALVGQEELGGSAGAWVR